MSEPINAFFALDRRAVVSLAMTWDGNAVVVATDSKQVELFSVQGERLGGHSRHQKRIEMVAVADDHSVVASLSERTQSEDWIEELLVWDRQRPLVRRIVPTFPPTGFRCPVFFPGKRFLAVDSDHPLIYDALTAQRLPLDFPEDMSCECLAFSPDGTLIALALDSGPILLGDLEKQTELARLEGRSAPADKLAFSDDGSLLASTSWDETLRIWVLSPAQERRCVTAPCQELFHLGYISLAKVWLVADRKHGFRIFGREQDHDIQIPLPKRTTVTALGTSRIGGRVAIGRVNGRIEIWRLFDLVPDLVEDTAEFASVGEVP